MGSVLGRCDVAVNRLDHARGGSILQEALRHKFLAMSPITRAPQPHTPLQSSQAGPSSKRSRSSFWASKHTSAFSLLVLRCQGVSLSPFHLTSCHTWL